MRRSGNVCDALVFCLVAFLLPAWLLGHLFLMFFPSSGTASQSDSNHSAVVAALADESSSDETELDEIEPEGMIELLSEEPENTTPSTSAFGQQKAHWEQKIDKFETAISDLKTENQHLTQQATELKDLESLQTQEIDQLKNRLEQISNDNGPKNLASMSTQLRDLQTDYAQLDEKFRLIRNENTQLESKVSDLASENQLAKQRQLQMQTEGLGRSETTKATVAASEKLLDETNQEKTRLQGQVKELTVALESTQSNLTSQKQELADANSQLQQLNAKYAMAIRRLTADASPRGDLTNSSVGEQANQIEIPQPTPSSTPATEQYREYVSSLGNRSRLAFVRWVGDDRVVVRSFVNKQLYEVSIKRFSVSDQQYLQSLKQINGR